MFGNYSSLYIQEIALYYDLFINYYFYGFHIFSRYTGPGILIFSPYLLFVAFVDNIYNDTHLQLEQKLHSIIFLIPNLILLFCTLKILYLYSDEGYDKRLDNFIGGNYFILEHSIKERLLEIKDERAYGLIWSGCISPDKRDLANLQEVFPPIFVGSNGNKYSKDLISKMPLHKVLSYSERWKKLYSPYMDVINFLMRNALGDSNNDLSNIIFDYAFHIGPNPDPDTLSIRLPSIREIHLKIISDMMVTNYVRRRLRIEDGNLVRKLYSYLETHDLKDLMRVEYQCDLLVELYGTVSGMTRRNELFSTLNESNTLLFNYKFLNNGFSYVDGVSSLREFGKDYPSIKIILSEVIDKDTLLILDLEVILVKLLLDRIRGCQADHTRNDDWRKFFEKDIEDTFKEFAKESNLLLLTDISNKFLYSRNIQGSTDYLFYSHYSIYNSSDLLYYGFNNPRIDDREKNSLSLSLRGFNMTIEFYDGGYSQVNMRVNLNEDNGIPIKGNFDGKSKCYGQDDLHHLETFSATSLNIFVPSQRSYFLSFNRNLKISIDSSQNSSLSDSKPVNDYLECALDILNLPQYEGVRFFLNSMDYDSIIPIIPRLPWDLGALQETYRVYSLCYDTAHSLLDSISKDERTNAFVTYWVEHTMFHYGNEMALAAISMKENTYLINRYKVTEKEVRNYADFYESGLHDLRRQDNKSLRNAYSERQDEQGKDSFRSMRMFAKIFFAISLRQALLQDLMQLIPFCRGAGLSLDTDSIRIKGKRYEPLNISLNTRREDEMSDYDYIFGKNYRKPSYQLEKGEEIRILLSKLVNGQNNLLSETSILTYLKNKHSELIIDNNQGQLNNLDRESKPNLPMIHGMNQEFLNFLNSHDPSLDTNPFRNGDLNDPNSTALRRIINDPEVSEDSDQRIVYDADSDFAYSYE